MAPRVLAYAASAVGDDVPCVPLTSPRLGFTPLVLSQRSTVCSDRRKLSCCNQNPGGDTHRLHSSFRPSFPWRGRISLSTPAKTRSPDSLPTGCKGQEGFPYAMLMGVGAGEGGTRHMSLNSACHRGISFPCPLGFPLFCSFQKVISVQCGIHVVLSWFNPGGQLNTTSR